MNAKAHGTLSFEYLSIYVFSRRVVNAKQVAALPGRPALGPPQRQHGVLPVPSILPDPGRGAPGANTP